MYLNNQNNANTQYDRLVSMITTLGYDPTDDELAAAGMSREQFQAYKDYYDKLNPTSSATGKTSGGTIDNGGLSPSDIAAMQIALGLSGSGLGSWEPNSQAAAQKKWGVSSADEAWKKYQAEIAGSGTGFTGTTYTEAAAYLRSKGLDASGLMTQSEWQRHKNNNDSAGGEHEASSYQEYLAAYIYGKTKK